MPVLDFMEPKERNELILGAQSYQQKIDEDDERRRREMEELIAGAEEFQRFAGEVERAKGEPGNFVTPSTQQQIDNIPEGLAYKDLTGRWRAKSADGNDPDQRDDRFGDLVNRGERVYRPVEELSIGEAVQNYKDDKLSSGHRILSAIYAHKKSIEQNRTSGTRTGRYIVSRLPFVGAGFKTIEALDAIRSAKRIDKNEAGADDYRKLGTYLAENQFDTDKNWLESGFDILSGMPAFVMEFIATGGAYNIGKQAVSKGIGAVAGRIASKGAAKTIEKVGTATAGRAVGLAAHTLANPQLIAMNAAQHAMPEMEISYDKLNITKQPGVGESLMRGFITSYIELGSEHSGKLIGKIISAPFVRRAARASFLKAHPHLKVADFKKLVKSRGWKPIIDNHLTNLEAAQRGTAIEFLKKGGLHGPVEEFLEERVGEVAAGATGTIESMTGLPVGTSGNYGVTEAFGRAAIGAPENPSIPLRAAKTQAAAEGLAFSVMGGSAMVQSKLSLRNRVKISGHRYTQLIGTKGTLKDQQGRALSISKKSKLAKEFYEDPIGAAVFATQNQEGAEKLVKGRPSAKSFEAAGLPGMSGAPGAVPTRSKFRGKVRDFLQSSPEYRQAFIEVQQDEKSDWSLLPQGSEIPEESEVLDGPLGPLVRLDKQLQSEREAIAEVENVVQSQLEPTPEDVIDHADTVEQEVERLKIDDAESVNAWYDSASNLLGAKGGKLTLLTKLRGYRKILDKSDYDKIPRWDQIWELYQNQPGDFAALGNFDDPAAFFDALTNWPRKRQRQDIIDEANQNVPAPVAAEPFDTSFDFGANVQQTESQGSFFAPDAVGDLIDPAAAGRSLGAAQRKVKSAQDLVGDFDEGTAGSAESVHASPDKTFEGEYQEARKGFSKKKLGEKMKDTWELFKKSTTRGSLPELPRTKQFGEARSAMQSYRLAGSVAVGRTEELLARTVKPLSEDDYQLFDRKVLLDDIGESIARGITKLPFKLTLKSAAQEIRRIDALAAKNPNVQAAIEYRNRWMAAVRKDYIDSFAAIGIDMSNKFGREKYFRHQVLSLMRARQREAAVSPGTRGAARAQTGRAWLKKRKEEGSELNYNANYFQAEWEVVTQMIADTHRATALARLMPYDIYRELREQAKEHGGVWEDYIPEGFDTYRFEPGRSMYQAYSVTEQIAMELMEEASESLEISKDDLRKVVALGQKHTPIVVPQEIVKQLAEIEADAATGWAALIDGSIKTPMRWWKTYRLLGPTNFPKYNLRNATEIDKVFMLNPSAVKKMPQAFRDLWKLYAKSEDASLEVRRWSEDGGSGTLMRINELGEVSGIKRLARLAQPKKKGLAKAAAVPEKLWRVYWEKVGLGTDFRESILRYALYLDYKQQIESSEKGVPKNYGMSNPAEVNGIIEAHYKAMRLSSDMMIDYSDTSVLGQFVADRFIPFHRFQEGNVRGYLQAVKNISNDDKLSLKAGLALAKKGGFRSAAIRAPLLAIKLGRIGLLLYGVKSVLTAFHLISFPDDDEEIPIEIRHNAHLTLGHYSTGEVRYFSRLGTASDALEWIGADAVEYDVMDVLKGKRTLKEVAGDYFFAPVNKFYGGLSPFIKTPVELATGKSSYPDVRRPRTIRDKGEYLARMMGHQREYRALAKKPSRGYLRNLDKLFIYTVEPNASAYYNMRDLTHRFLKKKGKSGGESFGKRADALRNYRYSLRFQDKRAEKKYKALYEFYGGTAKGIKASLKRMHPLAGLNQAEKKEFLSTLGEQDKEQLEKAVHFYKSVLRGGS